MRLLSGKYSLFLGIMFNQISTQVLEKEKVKPLERKNKDNLKNVWMTILKEVNMRLLRSFRK